MESPLLPTASLLPQERALVAHELSATSNEELGLGRGKRGRGSTSFLLKVGAAVS